MSSPFILDAEAQNIIYLFKSYFNQCRPPMLASQKVNIINAYLPSKPQVISHSIELIWSIVAAYPKKTYLFGFIRCWNFNRCERIFNKTST